jgi:N-acetylmuramoyl-L-alanine amidase
MEYRNEQTRERALGAMILGAALLLSALIVGVRLLLGGRDEAPVASAPVVTFITPAAGFLSPATPPAVEGQAAPAVAGMPTVAPVAPVPPAAPADPAGAQPAAAAPAAPAAPTAIVSEAPVTSETAPAQQMAATGKVVCIDPGHGGADLGNVRVENGQIVLREKDFTLQHSLALGERLQQKGYQVVFTRTTDAEANPTNLDVNGDGRVAAPGGEAKSDQLDDLQARVLICNQAGADVLVSVHYNGAENEYLQGYEVWYSGGREFSDRNGELATLAHAELGKAYAAAGYAANDRGIGVEDHAVTGPARPGELVPSEMPGVVVEGLFLSNVDDAAFIQTPQAQETIVNAYVNAIDRFLGGGG